MTVISGSITNRRVPFRSVILSVSREYESKIRRGNLQLAYASEEKSRWEGDREHGNRKERKIQNVRADK